jgi:uncharacterized protein YbaR (Trm112 family)
MSADGHAAPVMRASAFDVLRCPYCGGPFELVTSMFNRLLDEGIQDGILGCRCCIFPVIDGIPVLHLQPAAVAARGHVEAGRPDLARQVMFGLDDEAQAARFEAAAASPSATYRETVDALGPQFEGGYFLYRFSDPTYVVADAVVRAVAGTVAGSRRAVDICGGSGHLTRTLIAVMSAAPVLADLYFAKVWLARRFTAPGCEPVCCDGNSPLPFARGAFGFAMCSDAFQYIWTKRQFIGELLRVIDGPGDPGAAMINHTHNSLAWSPSHGQPLDPAGYGDLFETIEPRLFGEAGLLADIVKGGPLDLGRRDAAQALDRDPALTIVATRHPGVLREHALQPPGVPRGELRINPLYKREQEGQRLHLTLSFPSPDYEDEYGACRLYLPDHATIELRSLRALEAGGRPADLEELIRRRVIVDLPSRYY